MLIFKRVQENLFEIYEPVYGTTMTGWQLGILAKEEGFSDISDLFKWFLDEYGDKLFEKRFMRIRWFR